MPQVEVSLSDELVSELERMAEGEEFVNREEAVEQLLSAGIEAYTIE
ncbi:MAG: ribbon-helix-helix protein, CopG family, partial [Candidatus Nanohaloarchaea archaeon]|nr:ribbon-helix-helix protein, CopG family [Candidatus Nanohaloarchaea archaeon]